MTSPKNIVLVAGLMVFFSWVGYEVYSAVKEDKAKDSANLILSFKKRDLLAVEITYGQESSLREIVLKKNKLRWEMSKPTTDFVDHDYFFAWRDEILAEEGRKVEDIHNAVDWGKYGLQDPAAKVKFTFKKDQSVEVAVSALDTFDKKTYLKVSSDKQTLLYVGSTKWRAHLLKLPEDFQEKNLFSWSRKHWEKIQQLNWLRSTQAFNIIKGKNNQWRVEPKTIYPVDSSKIFSFLDDLSKFKITGLATEVEKDRALKSKPELRIEVLFSNTEDPDFNKQTLSFYKETVLKEDNSKDFIVYNTLGNRWLKISSEALHVLNPDVVDFFDFDFKLDTSKVTSVTVSNLGQFVKKDKLWQEGQNSKNSQDGKTFDGGKVNLLLNELNNLHATRFETQIKPNPKLILREFHVEGEGFDKKLVIYNQVGSSQVDKNLEDCYLVVEPDRNLPFWVFKSSIEKLLLIEFYK